jgi:trehalose 2-sulfotransferase
MYDLVQRSADYPTWNGRPQRTLLICTQNRAGSTLLDEAIYFAGGLGCPLEYYQPGFRPGLARRWNAAGLREYTAALHRFRTDPSGVFSVKLFWHGVTTMVGELKPDEFDSTLLKPTLATTPDTYRRIFSTLADFFPAPTLVFLSRRDEIRQAVSLYVAGVTGAWRQYERIGSGKKELPLYDFDAIVRLLAKIQNHKANWINFFRANQLRYYAIDYEDMEQDYEGTLREFFTAIGRPDASIVPPRLQKQADSHSEDLVGKFVAEFRQRVGH